MKTLLSTAIVAASLAAATSASAQTLGAAANYDMFALNGGQIEMVASNGLKGQVAFSNGTAVKVGAVQNFQGTIYKHTGASIDKPASLLPSGGIQSSASINSVINQANIDVANYATYLTSLSSTQSFGKVFTNFSYSSTMARTVLDFSDIDLSGETFTLNGRAAGTDQIIIRVSSAFAFNNSNLILTNLKTDNVIWYYGGNSVFDLHRSSSTPANFMKFAGTIVAPDGQIRMGEVNFTGRAIGTDLKLGSGYAFQGAVPEPSSSLMLLIGAGGLLMVRRRRK